MSDAGRSQKGMVQGAQPGGVVWVVVRDDDQTEGEWFVSRRRASLKATWIRQKLDVGVTVVRAVIAVEPPAHRR